MLQGAGVLGACQRNRGPRRLSSQRVRYAISHGWNAVYGHRDAHHRATTGNCRMHGNDETIAYDDVLLLIDGEWREAFAGERLPVVDPATEKQIGWVGLARIADLDAALAAAVRGFSAWRQTPPLARARVLAGAARLLRER